MFKRIKNLSFHSIQQPLPSHANVPAVNGLTGFADFGTSSAGNKTETGGNWEKNMSTFNGE